MSKQNEIIKKLQDKSYVRAFGLMSPEEQEVYRKVTNKNCHVYMDNMWKQACGMTSAYTYTIKPDYQLEPEYVDYEIYENINRLWCNVDGMICKLYELPSLPNFEGFHCPSHKIIQMAIDTVATEIDLGKKVYARMRK